MYLARHDTICGIGNTPDEAFDDLKDSCPRDPDINEVSFYEIKEIKVKQTILIIE